MTNETAAESTKPAQVTIAENVVLANVTIESEGESAAPSTPVGILDTVTHGSGEAMLTLLVLAANDGFASGVISQSPTDHRVDVLGDALRQIHRKELFGDCVEDGDRYPCKTIRALDIVGAGTPLPDVDPFAI